MGGGEQSLFGVAGGEEDGQGVWHPVGHPMGQSAEISTLTQLSASYQPNSWC